VSTTKAERRVFVDLDRCIGCKSCAAACFYGHLGMPGVEHATIAEGDLPMVCRQCEEPACVEACPMDALKKDEFGAVRRSRMLCVGCRSCAQACPFGVIGLELTDGLVGKCDLCADRLAEERKPRCVTACPAGALRFAVPSELEKDRLLLLSARTVGRNPVKKR